MNTWVLLTLIAVRTGVEPISAWEFTTFEECMVVRAERIAERIPKWRYECVPLIDEKAIKKGLSLK